jgi:hypothetical protein
MDPAVMTMANVTLCLVLVAYVLNREGDLPARRPHPRRHRPHHWRPGRARWPQARRGPGATGHP